MDCTPTMGTLIFILIILPVCVGLIIYLIGMFIKKEIEKKEEKERKEYWVRENNERKIRAEESDRLLKEYLKSAEENHKILEKKFKDFLLKDTQLWIVIIVFRVLENTPSSYFEHNNYLTFEEFFMECDSYGVDKTGAEKVLTNLQQKNIIKINNQGFKHGINYEKLKSYLCDLFKKEIDNPKELMWFIQHYKPKKKQGGK